MYSALPAAENVTGPLKVRKIETYVVDCYRTNWVFVKVTADDGFYGYGEASLEGRELSVAKAVDELSLLVIGEDAFAIERLHMLMQRDSYWRAGPILSTAISAIEIALWDIKGRALGVPVYELLGGAVRDRVSVYANSWFAGAREASEFAERAAAVVADGFTGLKWDPFGRSYLSMTTAELNASIANVAAVRDAVGPDVDLMIEGHGRFNVMTAIQVARALKDYNVRWFEEPTVPDRASSIAQVRQASPVAISAGERCYSRFACADLLDAKAVDVLQPDVCHVGGLLELKRAAAIADAALVPIAPHNPYGPICHAASLHFAASCSNFLVLETFVIDVPWRRDLSNESWSFVDGCFEVPKGPGLGVELNLEAFQKHPFEPHGLRHYTGALTDIRPSNSTRWF